MPSINLIWDQRVIRQKHQRIAMILLAVFCLCGGAVAAEVVLGTMKLRDLDRQIADKQKQIKLLEPIAKQNEDMKAQIATKKPVAGLLQTAQNSCLQWVALMNELNQCVPAPGNFVFTSFSFQAATTPPPAGAAASKLALLGKLQLGGRAKDFPSVTEGMRALAKQPHIGEVRAESITKLESGKNKGPGGVQFRLLADFGVREPVKVAEAPKDDKAKDPMANLAHEFGTDTRATLPKEGAH